MKRNLLLYLAEKTGLFSEIETSTKKIAQEINASQQSVSRLLIKFEKENKISRFVSPGGMRIQIRENGLEDLKKDYLTLKKIFQPEKKLKGSVITGFGEGKYYIKKYKSKIKEALGINPFLGTLNIKADSDKARSFLMNIEPVEISGFNDGERSFGSVKAYKAKINGVDGAILRPERNWHEKDVIEVIADINLRKKMKLKKGSSVELTK